MYIYGFKSSNSANFPSWQYHVLAPSRSEQVVAPIRRYYTLDCPTSAIRQNVTKLRSANEHVALPQTIELSSSTAAVRCSWPHFAISWMTGSSDSPCLVGEYSTRTGFSLTISLCINCFSSRSARTSERTVLEIPLVGYRVVTDIQPRSSGLAAAPPTSRGSASVPSMALAPFEATHR